MGIMVKNKKEMIFKVLQNYFTDFEVQIEENELYNLATNLNHIKFATFMDDFEQCIYYIINIENNVKNFDEIVNLMPNNFNNNNTTRIVLLVNNIQDKLFANTPEYQKDLKSAIKNKFKITGNLKFIDSITSEFIKGTKNKFEVSINNRVDRLTYELSGSDKKTAVGQVYIASLKNIVEMYNNIGDSIFDLNVRYGVKDILNVEDEIKSTLINEPLNFWFYNNGITVVIDKDKYNIDNPYTIELTNDSSLSIINGAQTVTAAAECFSRNPELIDSVFYKAKVLLRIIAIDKDDASFAKDVSIALNRQKCITEIDIATTSPFVNIINQQMQSLNKDPLRFEINKRGQRPTTKYHYYINNFAQIVEAYLNQKPGSSRCAKGVLIAGKSINGEYTFAKKDIFRDIKTLDDIIKYYSPVNYAHELNKSYKIIQKNNIEKSTLKECILKYANFYCVASIIFCLNENSNDDFSKFSHPDIKHNDELIKLFITCFYDFLQHTKIESVDSNDFKNDKLFNEFKNSEYIKKLYENIIKIK